MDKLAIFDLDGTLLDTIADLGSSVNFMLRRHSLPEHRLEDYKMMVGHGMRNLVTRALPEEMREETFIDGFLAGFLDCYLEHIDSYTKPYPGITEMLYSLQDSGMHLAVASNKIQAGTERLIHGFFPGIRFDAVLGNCSLYPLKPDPAVVDLILEMSGVPRAGAVMVGDSGTDIRTARNASIPCIAVSWGFRPRQDLAEADFIVDSSAGLLERLKLYQASDAH